LNTDTVGLTSGADVTPPPFNIWVPCYSIRSHPKTNHLLYLVSKWWITAAQMPPYKCIN